MSCKRVFAKCSASSGKFPSCWKIANVQSVPKKGDPSNPGNHRPIVICSNLAKVMQSNLFHKLMKYLEYNSMLNDREYGFRKNRSTGTLMALLIETWKRSVHLFGESKIVALNISKAFDRVCHQGLISKV